MLRRARGDRGARARRRSAAAGRPRRAGAAHRRHAPAPRRSTARRSTPRCARAAALSRPAAQGFRRHASTSSATGGYALAAYERWHRLKQLPRRALDAAPSPLVARQFRMNVGTIVEAPLIKVKLRRGPMLGEVEESFVQGLVPGDTFMFAGRLLRFEGVQGADRAMLARDRRRSQGAGLWRRPPAAHDLPGRRACAASCRIRRRHRRAAARGARMAAASSACRSRLPARDDLLVERIPARQPAVHRRLLLRGPERAPDAGHAADPAHGAHGLEAAGLRRHRLRARHLGPAAADQGAARRSCSTRTCWATTSRRGWPRSPCCAAPSATSR